MLPPEEQKTLQALREKARQFRLKEHRQQQSGQEREASQKVGGQKCVPMCTKPDRTFAILCVTTLNVA